VYEPAYNIHKNGILVESIIPAKINQEIVDKAKKAAEDITKHM